MQFTVATANICSNPRGGKPRRRAWQKKVTQVENAILHVSNNADIVLWQEIWPGYPEYLNALLKLGPGWSHQFINYEIPISFRTKMFGMRSEGVQFAHQGHVSASPSRYNTWVDLNIKTINKRIRARNAHYVSGAWCSVKQHPWHLFKQWRKDMWMVNWKRENELHNFLSVDPSVAGLVWGGDYNKVVMPGRFIDQNVAITHGIDHIWHSSGIDLVSTRILPVTLGMDHNPIVATFEI